MRRVNTFISRIYKYSLNLVNLNFEFVSIELLIIDIVVIFSKFEMATERGGVNGLKTTKIAMLSGVGIKVTHYAKVV